MTLRALVLAMLEMFGLHPTPAIRARVQAVAPIILAEAAAQRVDPWVVAAVAFRESGFDPTVTGARGELGVMQILPNGAALSVCPELLGRLRDPAANIRCGVRILAHSLRVCGHYLAFGLSRYNGLACRRSRYASKVLAVLPLRYQLRYE